MRKTPYKLSPAQELMLIHLRELKLEAVAEHTFHPDRRWRFDIYLPEPRIGIEIDGGMWGKGHRHHAAIEMDHDKQNAATMMGIRCLRFTNRQVLSGKAKAFFEEQL